MLTRTIILILLLIITGIAASNYQVRISSDGPIVKGGTIHFFATVYEENEISQSSRFRFFWMDNGIPQHERQSDIQNATDLWTVSYDADEYAAGQYIVNVVVKSCFLDVVCYEVTSARSYFDITETINGKMLLIQNNKTRDRDFVSNTSTVVHEIEMKESDRKYISKAPLVLTYWFVDCTYYGITSDFKFPFNFSIPGEEHIVEALIMADFTPLPPTTTVPPSTTTPKPTTTTSKPTPTTGRPNNITTSSSIVNNSSVMVPTVKMDVVNTLRKRSLNQDTMNFVNIPKLSFNETLDLGNPTFPFVCNSTQVATDSKKSYGYFSRNIHVKAPISKVNVTGNNWIQHGDLLSLKVQCHGSRNIEYCLQYKTGAYNVTGNETCFHYTSLEACSFPINRYLPGSKYTVLIIIRNEVSSIVQPVTVTFYEVTTQPQLSVIVVPVAFSLVAVVLIVFGIAYYIQNRSRFIIEVADFNFGQQYSDLEYKTFRERLRDSIMNAFTRGPTPSSSEVPVWPPGRKYGSMT